MYEAVGFMSLSQEFSSNMLDQSFEKGEKEMTIARLSHAASLTVSSWRY